MGVKDVGWEIYSFGWLKIFGTCTQSTCATVRKHFEDPKYLIGMAKSDRYDSVVVKFVVIFIFHRAFNIKDNKL